MKPEPISDFALVRAFNEARKALPLADALRLTVETANRYLTDQLPSVIAQVVEAVSVSSGQTVEDLLGPKDTKVLWEPRRLAWWVLRRRFSVSYADIGRAFGGRHRTTICRVLDAMRGKVCGDAGLRAQIEEVGVAVERRAAA